MEKILEFFKTLFVPRLMSKYRYMSVLISIIIFMVSVYVLQVPITNQIQKSLPELKQSYNYLALQEIDDSFAEFPENQTALQKLADLECSVVEGLLECPKLNKLSETEEKIEYELFEEEVVFEKDGITKKIFFVVDLNTSSQDFNVKDSAKENEIKVTIEEMPYVDNEEVYFVRFMKDVIYFQAHQIGINDLERSHNNNLLIVEGKFYSYATYMSDLTLDVEDVGTIGERLIDALILADINYYTSQTFTYIFLIIFVLPIIFVLIFWLFFRKNSKLTTYKEYYNIAAITSIIPVILTFILAWFWPDVIGKYMYAFALFYLFNLYKINNSPDEIV